MSGMDQDLLIGYQHPSFSGKGGLENYLCKRLYNRINFDSFKSDS